jgi:hypothetical protein
VFGGPNGQIRAAEAALTALSAHSVRTAELLSVKTVPGLRVTNGSEARQRRSLRLYVHPRGARRMSLSSDASSLCLPHEGNCAGSPASASRSGTASLAWVRISDGVHHVSTWAHLPPRKRPRNAKGKPVEVVCPVCERPVVIRIPKAKIHHAAHAPGDLCPVTQPETALHFNLKCLIAAELRVAAAERMPLLVQDTCVVGNWGVSWGSRYDTAPPQGIHRSEWLAASPCSETRERVWLEAWDRVELEHRVGNVEASRIPDVVLYSGDRLVGAIEVLHTHAVDDDKAAMLAALEVKWIEVRADERLIAQENAWTAREPLPIHREGPSRPWRCKSHLAALKRELAAERRRRAQAEWREEAEREAARHTQRVCAVKLVDVLYPSGKPWRNIYSVFENCTNGIPHSIGLQRGGDILLTVKLGSVSKPMIWSRIEAMLNADLRGVETKRGAKTDSPMSWARGPLAPRMSSGASAGEWKHVPLEQTHPIRYRFAKRTASWFIPEDLRDVRWDRAEDDDLSKPHEAWLLRKWGKAQTLRAHGQVAGVTTTDRVGAEVSDRGLPAGAGPIRVDQRAIEGADTRAHRPVATAKQRRGHVDASHFGDRVKAVMPHPAGTVFELRSTVDNRDRAFVVVNDVVSPEAALELDRLLATAGVLRVWLARREHWTNGLPELPWLPLVAAVGGGHGVPIGGYSVPLAEAAAAMARGAPEFTPETVQARRIASQLTR